MVEVGLGTGEIVNTETWDEIVVCTELEDEVLERVCESEEDFEDEGDVIGEEINAEETPEVINSGIENEEVQRDDVNVNPDVDVQSGPISLRHVIFKDYIFIWL